MFQEPIAFPTQKPAVNNDGRASVFIREGNDTFLEIQPFHQISLPLLLREVYMDLAVRRPEIAVDIALPAVRQ